MHISIERAVISGIVSHALAYEKEVSGLLLGLGSADGEVFVSDFAVYGVVGSEAQVEIPANFLAKVREDLEGKKKFIVGWYHSHPQRNAFISRRDEETQKKLQQFNSNFISLNIAFRNENGEKIKTITEMLCYKLRNDGKPEYFPVRIVDRFSSEVALGDIRADIERARKVLKDLKGILDPSDLTKEIIQPMLKFNNTMGKIMSIIAEEVEKLHSVMLPDIEEKSRRIQEENEEVEKNNSQLREELKNAKVVHEHLLEIKTQIERKLQEFQKENQDITNNYIKSKEENKNLRDENRKVITENLEHLRRISVLENNNSQLQKEIRELKEEKLKIEIFEEKKENSKHGITGKQVESYPKKEEDFHDVRQ